MNEERNLNLIHGETKQLLKFKDNHKKEEIKAEAAISAKKKNIEAEKQVRKMEEQKQSEKSLEKERQRDAEAVSYTHLTLPTTPYV